MFVKAVHAAREWLTRVRTGDPVDDLNSPFVQVLLMILSFITVPSWIYSLFVRAPSTLVEWAALWIDMALTLTAWAALVLVRRGQFRAGVTLMLALLLVSAAIIYAITGYHHGSRDAYPTIVLAIAGLALGRRALWLAYGALVGALLIGQLADNLWLAGLPPETGEVSHAIPIRVIAYLVIALIFDRFTNTFRIMLAQARESSRQLVVTNHRLQEEVEERGRTLNQLIHSQRVDVVGRATAGLAHDFDNILNVVLGYASEREKLADWGTPALLNALEGVELAALRGLAINRKLLNFSRKDTGPAQVIDLAEVLRELEPMLRQLLGRYIQTSLQIHDDNVLVWFDRSQFELVILNMASNARDAMPEGGRFIVFLEKSADGCRAELTLTDTGSGMSEAVQAKVFEPFYTTKAFGTGTGLGLSVVASIIDAAKGQIVVTSMPHEGTQFRITLPLYGEPGAKAGENA